MVAKAQTRGFPAAKRWIRDLLRAIRHQSGDPGALGPLKKYVDPNETLDLVRPPEKGRRCEPKRSNGLSIVEKRWKEKDKHRISGIRTVYATWVLPPPFYFTHGVASR